jgi:hypothetical protein
MPAGKLLDAGLGGGPGPHAPYGLHVEARRQLRQQHPDVGPVLLKPPSQRAQVGGRFAILAKPLADRLDGVGLVQKLLRQHDPCDVGMEPVQIQFRPPLDLDCGVKLLLGLMAPGGEVLGQEGDLPHGLDLCPGLPEEAGFRDDICEALQAVHLGRSALQRLSEAVALGHRLAELFLLLRPLPARLGEIGDPLPEFLVTADGPVDDRELTLVFEKGFRIGLDGIQHGAQVRTAGTRRKEALAGLALARQDVPAAAHERLVVDAEEKPEGLFRHAVEEPVEGAVVGGLPVGAQDGVLLPLRRRKASSAPSALRSLPPMRRAL